MREFFVNRPDTAAMERLLGSHASDAAGVAVRLAWQAGLLRDEITNLTWDQVDFERNQLGRFPLLKCWQITCVPCTENGHFSPGIPQITA